MLARQYLNCIRGIQYRLKVAENEIEEVERDVYLPKGTDYSSTKVNGGRPSDLCDKVIRCDERKKRIEDKIQRLYEVREEAAERIWAMENQEHANVLFKYYVSCESIDRIEKTAAMSRASVYRVLKQAEIEFSKMYQKWIDSIESLQTL